jgi:ABC-2 type transport system permease protein
VSTALQSPNRTPIKGPTALGSDPKRLWQLSRLLAVTDFKLRFFGSVLGYLWQFMRPLMLFGVLYVVFSVFFDAGTNVPFYPVSLLLGIVLFGFFGEATGGSVRALVERENLVRKIEFPRLAVPLSRVMTALMNLSLNFIPVLIFCLASGATPRWSWLQLPFVVLFLAIFALGLAMALSTLFVQYRDVEPIWDVLTQILFYASPILYTLQIVQEKAGTTVMNLLAMNPFTAAMEQARHALLGPGHYTAAEAIGGTVRLLIPFGITVAVFVCGFTLFNRRAPRIAEDL